MDIFWIESLQQSYEVHPIIMPISQESQLRINKLNNLHKSKS